MVGFSNLTTAASARAAKPGPQINGSVYAVAAVSGDAMINGGGAAFQTVTGPVYAYGSFGANNGPHSTGVPSVADQLRRHDLSGQPDQPARQRRWRPNGLNYHTTDGRHSAEHTRTCRRRPTSTTRPRLPAAPPPMYLSAAAAKDAAGNWKPGIYNGFAPSGGTMNGGVYKIINSPNLASGHDHQHHPHRVGDVGLDRAVAIVLDSSDTGSLDISEAMLNGLDDLNPAGIRGPRDPQGTHNFVIFGGNGPTGYCRTGSPSGRTPGTDMSGIIYLPKSRLQQQRQLQPAVHGLARRREHDRQRWRQRRAGVPVGVRPERRRGPAVARRPAPVGGLTS